MSTVVKSVGRVIRVSIPEKIGTIDGHDPVTDDTKSQIAGQEWIFPRGLTVVQLRERIINRLREDYHVGYVDLEINEDAEISYISLGRRVAGIGPTLPPRHAAIAVTANPPPSASPGDMVQVWELAGDDADTAEADAPADDVDGTDVTTNTDLPTALLEHPDRWYRPNSEAYAFAVRTPDGERRYRRTAAEAADLLEALWGNGETPESANPPPVPAARLIGRGELRGRAGDVATVMLEKSDIDQIDQSKEHRLVTVPSGHQPEKELANLLRAANESMDAVQVADGSQVESIPVGALRPSVVSIETGDGDVETLPPRHRQCAPGDTLYVIGRHDQLRKLGEAANETPVSERAGMTLEST